MERDVGRMHGHVIICGWGRVGREVADFLASGNTDLVVVDRDPKRLVGIPFAHVCGDVADDETLLQAGVQKASTLIAALDTDADNLYVTVAAKSLCRDIMIIPRARNESSESKLVRAGADRVVNPQQLGGDRMASFVTQPHVVDFIDVVMHDGTLEFRLEEVTLGQESALAGKTLRSAHLPRCDRSTSSGHPTTGWPLHHQSFTRRHNRSGGCAHQHWHRRPAQGTRSICRPALDPHSSRLRLLWLFPYFTRRPYESDLENAIQSPFGPASPHWTTGSIVQLTCRDHCRGRCCPSHLRR